MTVFDTELISIKGVDPEKEPAKGPSNDPVKEENPVSSRQNGLDHMMLIFAGTLISVSALLAFFYFRRGRRGGRYEAVKLQNL